MKDPRQQRGAALVLIALMAVGLTAAAGMAADAGAMYYKRTKMQAAADAAALAGARGLLDSKSTALTQAQRLASENGFELDASNVTFPPNWRVRVALKDPQPMLLGQLLGMSDPTIAVSSDSELHCVPYSFGVRPWGVKDRVFTRGQEVVLKFGPGDALKGNYMALAIDGTGADLYQAAIRDGSKTTINVGQLVATETGNMSGPTQSAVAELLRADRRGFEDSVKDGDKSVRLVKIAVLDPRSVDAMAGRSKVRVSGFARFYLDRVTSNGEVIGRFVERVAGRAVAGTATQYTVKLVE